MPAAFEAASARPGPRLRALQRALVGLVDGIDSPATLANHLAFLQLDLVDPELRAIAVAHARLERRHISILLRAARAVGELDAPDLARLAATVHTISTGAMITWAVDGRGTLASWLGRDVDTVLAPHRLAVAPRVPSSS